MMIGHSLANMRSLVGAMVMFSAVISSGCGDDGRSTADNAVGGSTAARPVVSSDSDCVVRLHGKGGDGEPTRMINGVVEVSPAGNGEGWGARQWSYAAEDDYVEARAIVAEVLRDVGCTTAVVNGFSNGGSFGAALYCRGENFDDTVIGYVIDDPVPDESALDCAPPPRADLVLYWTNALDPSARPGTRCADLDWTCAGDALVGIDAYAEALGTDIVASPNTGHEWFRDAPEIRRWLAN